MTTGMWVREFISLVVLFVFAAILNFLFIVALIWIGLELFARYNVLMGVPL